MSKKQNILSVVFTVLLFGGGISAQSLFQFRYFETHEAFEKQYVETIQQYQQAEKDYSDAFNRMTGSCNQKLQTRCQYVQDKAMDMNELDPNGSLFCKQVECYNAYGSYLENIHNPFSLSGCQQRDKALSSCDQQKDHRQDNFIKLGMREGYTYIIPPKAPFYKIQQMIQAQNMAYDAGFSTEEAKEIVYQLNVENGTWNPTHLGDPWCRARNGKEDYCFKLQQRGIGVERVLHYCSFGLVQYNTCIHHNVKAEDFIANPENRIWIDSHYQMKRLIDFLVDKKTEYGNFKQAQVHWNFPVAAQQGAYKSVAYYNRLSNMKEKFNSPEDELGAIEITIPARNNNIGESEDKSL